MAILKSQRHFFLKIPLILLVFVLAASNISCIPDHPFYSSPESSSAPGALAYQHVFYLSMLIGPREAGTEKEAEAADYIAEAFAQMGYNPQIQNFVYSEIISADETVEYPSLNIVVKKPGLHKQQIIVGAHYDSITKPGYEEESKGADDNASGVGVMLEIAEKIKESDNYYTLVFIAFGAEETGLSGSYYYTSQMTAQEIDNTIVMINLDSLIAGDKKYVHGGAGEKGWVRNRALQIAAELGLSLETNPGLNEYYPAGTSGPWSDHYPFEKLGIDYAFFEATNWEIGDFDGYMQTEEFGTIFHTPLDCLDFLEENYPGRVREHLKTFSTVLHSLLLDIAVDGRFGRFGVSRY